MSLGHPVPYIAYLSLALFLSSGDLRITDGAYCRRSVYVCVDPMSLGHPVTYIADLVPQKSH